MKTPVMRDPLTIEAEMDWGVVPTMIDGESRTSGVLLYKGPNGEAEAGIWICNAGLLELPCHVG